MSLTQRQQEIKDEFIKVRGTWGDAWEAILRLDPEFLASYLKFSAVPWRKNHLDDKVKEFIYIAVDANATHMYLPGVRQHIAAALRLGATPQEIMEVLELSATLGIHAMNIGVPILVEVLEEKGLRTGPAPLTDYQEAGQGGVHRDPRVLALVLGRDARARPRAVRRLHRVLLAPLAARHARAQDQGVHLHRVRHRGDAPVRQGAQAAHRERGRATARRRRRSSRSWRSPACSASTR